MDAKEIKSSLKQAREAIKEKDFKAALKYCKSVLKSDKNNYNAWVFVGAAAQEIDQPEQAEAAFKRAIEISPDQLLAWQGLCSFYEKHETKENIPELCSVYLKLLEMFTSDTDKKLEIYDKLIALLRKQDDKTKLIKVLKSKLEMLQSANLDTYPMQKQIFKDTSGKTELSEAEKQMLSEALKTIISHEEFCDDDCKRIFTTCIEILYKAGDENYALSLALEVFKKFPQNSSCLEFLSRVAMNLYIENGTIISHIDEISQRMLKCGNSSGLPLIFEGFCAFVSKDYIGAIQKLKTGLKSLEYYVQGWYFLSKSQYLLHRYSDSERSAKTGINVALESKLSSVIVGKFYLLLGQSLAGREIWDSALKALDKCASYLGQSKELLITFCFTLLKMEQVSKTEQMCQDLKDKFPDDPEVLQVEGYTLLLKSQYDEALQKLRLSLSMAESAFTLHLIGLVLWESQQRDKAFKVFLKAVELDPYLAKNFLYLGHYYQNHLHDKSKACLCYQKAFDLDNTDTEIGMSYSKILQDLGKEEDNMRVLKVITERANLGSCKWAWTQLGLCQLKMNLISDAIFSLQNALRADPNSSSGWECLADAYLKRGSYESALKAFEKVVELNPKAMYPLYQIATIQKMRGLFTDGIEKFKNLLDIVPTYVPALIGLAETYILAAKKALSECLYGLARDCCQETLNTLAKAAGSKHGLSSLWKLAGDACSIPFGLDDEWFPITVPYELHQETEKETVSCNKSQLLTFGSKFFGRALQIKDSVSTLWHDLGVNCHLQSMLATDRNEKVNFAKKAFICFQKAVSLCPGYEPHWTALGVIAVSEELEDWAFGQHALIKSLSLNKFNAETWTNLGVLYLEKENIELAHLAFKMAQSAEPTYPLSWIGQAFIADKVKHSETVDLYRHATTLGSHNEALIGYSRVICETLLYTTNKESFSYKYNIEQMNAVLLASDCAVKFVANNYNCAEAFNILGMLLERQGIYNASLKAYERALKLLEARDEKDFVELVRANYARILCVVGDIKGAIKEFLLLKKVDVSIICGFALAMYKDQQYEQSLKLLGQAFEKSKNPSDQSHIKVAMAMVAGKLSGPDAPNPLVLLVESAKISPKSVPGLLALHARGILKEESKLIMAAQKELQPYKYKKEYAASAAFLWAAQAYLTKGVKSARNELLKFIHCFPTLQQTWMQTACCLLQWDTKYADVAATCTKIGIFHGGCKEQASQIYALCQMAKGSRRGALSAAQKAVHINPEKLSNWATLAAACHVADLDQKHVGWMFSFVRKLAKEQGVKSDFLGWFIVMEIFHHINCGNMTVAGALTNQALSISAFSSEIQSCLQVLDAVVKVYSNNGNLQPLFLAVKENPKSFFAWNVLSQLLIASGSTMEAEKTISHFVVTAEKIFPNWTVYPLLQLAMLSYKAMHTNPDEKEKWLKLGEEVSGKAVHLAPSSQAARFLQGIIALEAGNSNLARRSFEKVLSSPSVNEAKWMESIASEVLELKNIKRKSKDQGS
ncbi:SKI3 subunit of superkiller complex protein-like [Argiope bruennichi]|uniref:SKI3 subunit of superkiller complex protein-like n=1 Tax=Argiope bruennichi TaxID=94029 RepID=UPI0024943069|nr:SKI3 subunit of superkiller complex protein-like [Argiope bruennichi]XP_055938714.1 SKI3 subunit of superkiller complex protein-like [Argiope bruennichi]